MSLVEPLERRPRGLGQIVSAFGDPLRYLVADGTVRYEWPRKILDRVELVRPIPLSWDPTVTASRVSCHHRIKEPLAKAFAMIEDAGLWKEIRDYAGCYNWRAQRGASKLSTHCWGIALDFDTRDGRNALGTDPVIHPGIVQCFEAAGFYWGGRFERQDGMHFQFCEGY